MAEPMYSENYDQDGYCSTQGYPYSLNAVPSTSPNQPSAHTLQDYMATPRSMSHHTNWSYAPPSQGLTATNDAYALSSASSVRGRSSSGGSFGYTSADPGTCYSPTTPPKTYLAVTSTQYPTYHNETIRTHNYGHNMDPYRRSTEQPRTYDNVDRPYVSSTSSTSDR
jgi:hypothetical protein